LAHIQKCPSGKDMKKILSEKVFLLRIADRYSKDYFLYIEMRERATLQTLDTFLRKTWVECCGHLSQFSVGGKTKKIGDVVEAGTQFIYEYDFGSTTELVVEVIEYGKAKISESSIGILARNNDLNTPCHLCKNLATEYCVECTEDIDSKETENIPFYCYSCARNKKHHHDEEMFLPVVNSPRMGICGYTG
jgi:cytidine deaminase